MPDTSPEKGGRAIDHSRRFDRIWEEHFDAVYGFARRRAGEEAAREAVADTFTVAWRRLDDVPAEPLPWLLGTCRKVLSNQRRGDARRLGLVERLRGLAPVAVPDTADRSAEAQALRDALASLGRRDREALALTAWDGLSMRDAAAVCGCSPGAFANRLQRARERLAAALASQDAAPAGPGTPPVEEAL